MGSNILIFLVVPEGFSVDQTWPFTNSVTTVNFLEQAFDLISVIDSADEEEAGLDEVDEE